MENVHWDDDGFEENGEYTTSNPVPYQVRVFIFQEKQ